MRTIFPSRFAEMCRLDQAPERYVWLDAAQLVKHAFGLARTFPRVPATLLYLYCQPSGAERISSLLEHRREIDAFSRRVVGSHPRFRAMSYRELWDTWSQQAPQDWPAAHLEHLKARYAVVL